MSEPLFNKAEDFRVYEANAIILHGSGDKLELSFAILNDLKAGPNSGGTFICQVNVPVNLSKMFRIPTEDL